MAEKKLMEKVVRKVLRSFPKVNMPDPFVPYPIAYPPTAKSRFEILCMWLSVEMDLLGMWFMYRWLRLFLWEL